MLQRSTQNPKAMTDVQLEKWTNERLDEWEARGRWTKSNLKLSRQNFLS